MSTGSTIGAAGLPSAAVQTDEAVHFLPDFRFGSGLPGGPAAVGKVALCRPAALQVLNTFDIIKERHMFK